MILPILLLGIASFILSWLLTALMIRISPKLGFVDKPGGRKIHDNPKPLGGGVAIFWSFAIVMLAALGVVDFADREILKLYPQQTNITDLIAGGQFQTPLSLGVLGAMMAMHGMGILDDRKPLGPFAK